LEAGSDATARRIGVGCFTAFAGFWSGGMVGVLVAKLVGGARRCTPPEGLPACDWYYYALGGMLLGAVTLPLLALRRLRQRKD
jgi:hypothetical protein